MLKKKINCKKEFRIQTNAFNEKQNKGNTNKFIYVKNKPKIMFFLIISANKLRLLCTHLILSCI